MSKDALITSLSSFEEYKKLVDCDTSIIKFSGTWCAPCKKMSIPYQKLANENSDFKFYEVDVDDGAAIALHEDITAIPAFVVYHNGERMFSYVGANERELRETITNGLTYIMHKRVLLADPINGKLSSLFDDIDSDLDI